MIRSTARIAAAIALVLNLAACQQDAVDEADILDEARAKIAGRRYAEALELVRGLVAENPDDARIQRIYGEALLATGQASQAVWPLTRAFNDPEQAVVAGILLASAQLQGGSGHDAIATATKVIELEPDNPRAYMLRARAYLDQKGEEECLADLDRAVEFGIEDDTIDITRTYALFGLGRIEEAEALLQSVADEANANIESNPKRAAEICAVTAEFAAESGDVQLAAQRYQDCLDGQGLRNELLTSRAMTFFDKIGDGRSATDIARRRFELDDLNLQYRVAYAQRLAQFGAIDDAEELLREGARYNPEGWSALVDFFMDQSRFEEALGALENAIEQSPVPKDGWLLSRCDLLIILGRHDEAKQFLPDIKVDVHRLIIEGRLLLVDEDLEGAAEKFDEALVLWPNNPDLRYLAGYTQERLGDWGLAASHFREAARTDPPHYLSSTALGEIMKGLGDIEGRLFVLLRLADSNPHDAEVFDQLIDHARFLGNQQLVQQIFVNLSRMPGEQGRAIANVARAFRQTDGAQAALDSIDTAGVNLDLPALFKALEAKVGYMTELGQGPEAIKVLDEVIAANEDEHHRARVLSLRGSLHLEAGAVEAALADLNSAMEISSDDPETLVRLARATEAKGDKERARELFVRAAVVEKSQQRNRAEAAMAFARFEDRSGDSESAKRLLRGILSEQPRHPDAGLALAQILLREKPSDRAPSKELLAAARQALLFEQSEEAAELMALFPNRQPAQAKGAPQG